MGDNNVRITDRPAKRSHCVGTDTDKSCVTYRDKTCKAGDQVQAHDGNNSDEDIINHQHGFITQLKQNWPSKEKNEKQGKDRLVQICQKCSLFLFVRSKEISCC